MPSPFRKLGSKVKAIFRSLSRDGRPSTVNPSAGRPEGLEATASSSAPPSTTAGILAPAVIVTPALYTAGLYLHPRDEDPHQSQHADRSDSPITPTSGGSSGEPAFRRTFSTGAASTSSCERPSAGVDQALAFGGNAATPTNHFIPSSPRPVAVSTAFIQPSVPQWQGQDLSSTCPTMGAGTSYFPGAHGFHVQNQYFTTSVGPSKTLFEYLDPHIAHGAAHNSAERCDAPACHRETRVAVQGDIVSWIKCGEGADKPKKLMWLSGPAGSGKTAIAGSVAETCQSEGLLAATFFFSSFLGSADRRSKRCVVTTIASHLADHDALHEFKAQLHVSIERNPSIFHKRLKEQAECLLLGPFHTIRGCSNTSTWPVGIIIDGLDEVEAEQYHDPMRNDANRKAEDDQLEVLEVLFTLATNPDFPFQILVSSRPEHNITNFFNTEAQASTVRLFLDSKYNPDADIERFLVSKLAHIRRHSGITSPSWPGQPVLNRLVEMSSGQFIVPTTIIRWVEAGVPQLQLAEVLELGQLNTGTNPFATLDALYHHILKRAHNTWDDPHLVVKWIPCITSALYPGTSGALSTAKFWRQFLENVEGELSYRFAPITSLISIPPLNDTSSPITIYHKSLTDFLFSPTRCGDLYVSETEYESFIAERISVVLKNKGPAVPCSAPADLARFIGSFFYLRAIMGEFPTALAPLSESSKAELASCDVAWWTTVSLSVFYSDGLGLPFSGNVNSTRSSGEELGHHTWLVQVIYQNIHLAMGCNPNTPSSTQPALPQAPGGSKCHAACIHWRTGILAKAKELGWCVHELEEVELNELQDLTWEDVRWKFSKAGGKRHDTSNGYSIVPPCNVCQPC